MRNRFLVAKIEPAGLRQRIREKQITRCRERKNINLRRCRRTAPAKLQPVIIGAVAQGSLIGKAVIFGLTNASADTENFANLGEIKVVARAENFNSVAGITLLNLPTQQNAAIRFGSRKKAQEIVRLGGQAQSN